MATGVMALSHAFGMHAKTPSDFGLAGEGTTAGGGGGGGGAAAAVEGDAAVTARACARARARARAPRAMGLRRVLFVRHGECEMNLALGSVVGGRADDSPLTARGEAQAEALAAGAREYVARRATLDRPRCEASVGFVRAGQRARERVR